VTPARGLAPRRVPPDDPAVSAPALRIGPLALGTAPCVAVPVDDGVAAAELRALRARGLDLAELRIDHFAAPDAAAVRAVLDRCAGIPTLATIRIAAEGGAWTGTEAARARLFLALLDAVDAVDVELAAGEVLAEVAPAAQAAGRLVIASHHDFAATPPPPVLADVVARARAAGADVVKIAAAVRGPEDVRTLARVLLEPAPIGRIVVGMGEAGLATRVLFPALGSLVTYAHSGRATAPGQLPLDELVALLRRLHLRPA
jgi:3-dehydroquinate dehydratase-1